mgnify:CR=1 FL=1
MRTRPFQQVDVFTATPLRGNPLAVVLDGEGLNDAQMQAVHHLSGPSLVLAGAIIAGWAERDPVELAQNVAVFEEPATRDAALHVALAKWQRRDPAAAEAFASSLTPRS